MTFSKRVANFVILGALTLIIQSCGVNKFIAEDDSIIKEHEIKGISKNEASRIEAYLRPKANRTLLYFTRPNLWAYLWAEQGKEKRFKTALSRSMGEAPAYFNESVIEQNNKIITQFLFDEGYFNAEVSAKFKTKRKKTSITYTIIPNRQFKIDSIIYQMPVGEVATEILNMQKNTLLKPGDAYNLKNLDKERERIASNLKNNGYFYFGKDFINFVLDTLSENGLVKVRFQIKQPKQGYLFQKFEYDTIIINTAFSFGKSPYALLDTVYQNGLTYIQPYNNDLKRRTVEGVINIRRGYEYNEDEYRKFQQRIADLGVFGYQNFQVTPKIGDTANYLNVYAALIKEKKRNLAFSFEGSTNATANLGIQGNTKLINRNFFRGAERLEIGINGGIESQPILNPTETNRNNLYFNTTEFGVNAVLFIPRFIFPATLVKTSTSVLSPQTLVSLSYAQQNRLDYDRAIAALKYGFEWNFGNKKLGYFPLVVNLGRTTRIDSLLLTVLDNINDPFLRFSFTNHLTNAANFVYFADYPVTDSRKHPGSIRFSVESAGQLLNLAYLAFNKEQNEDFRKFFGLPYFQYLRFDTDLRKNLLLNNGNIVALRFFGGVGLTFNNFNTMPIEKRFIAGGNNSMRGWQARTLGPGNYNAYSNQRIDQFGEFRLEGNAEYRFKLTKALELGLFTDIGNIWVRNDTASQKEPYVNFQFNKFYKDLAVGSGFGVRYDFSFFIIRVDLGLKVRDPAFKTGETWVIGNLFNKNWRSSDWVNDLNPGATPTNSYQFFVPSLAIGYPF